MNNEQQYHQQREKQRKGYMIMRLTRDYVMAILILGMAVFMLLGDKFTATKEFVLQVDPVIRYIFGSMCVLYGGFRLYRAIKHDY